MGKSNSIASTIFLLIFSFALGITFASVLQLRPDYLPKLPSPEIISGERSSFGIDANINESTIDQYLRRRDSVYYDMRMLDDPTNFGVIDGDRNLSGFVKGFEVVPLPYIVNVDSALPEAVGSAYSGPSLFTYTGDSFDVKSSYSKSSKLDDPNDYYTANYSESMSILKGLFPTDKYIFLMCGDGEYAGIMKTMLVHLGWNPDFIYVVGGYWYYEGKNKVDIKNSSDDYEFYKVPYHNIDFDSLTEADSLTGADSLRSSSSVRDLLEKWNLKQ